MPRRIQRQRKRGWRTPLCSCGSGHTAIYVGRGTKWGNPFKVAPVDEGGLTLEQAINGYHYYAKTNLIDFDARRELAGHDIVCWCPTDRACHGDLLLAWARGDDS